MICIHKKPAGECEECFIIETEALMRDLVADILDYENKILFIAGVEAPKSTTNE